MKKYTLFLKRSPTKRYLKSLIAFMMTVAYSFASPPQYSDQYVVDEQATYVNNLERGWVAEPSNLTTHKNFSPCNTHIPSTQSNLRPAYLTHPESAHLQTLPLTNKDLKKQKIANINNVDQVGQTDDTLTLVTNKLAELRKLEDHKRKEDGDLRSKACQLKKHLILLRTKKEELIVSQENLKKCRDKTQKEALRIYNKTSKQCDDKNLAARKILAAYKMHLEVSYLQKTVDKITIEQGALEHTQQTFFGPQKSDFSNKLNISKRYTISNVKDNVQQAILEKSKTKRDALLAMDVERLTEEATLNNVETFFLRSVQKNTYKLIETCNEKNQQNRILPKSVPLTQANLGTLQE